MFCKNFKSEFQKAKRLLEDKAIKAAAEFITRVGARLIVLIESEGVHRLTDLTAFEDDEKLMDAVKKAINNAIAASAHMQSCLAFDDPDERVRCYVAALKKLDTPQYKDEVGLFAARTLQGYIAIIKGQQEKIGVLKIIIEGIILSVKKR